MEKASKRLRVLFWRFERLENGEQKNHWLQITIGMQSMKSNIIALLYFTEPEKLRRNWANMKPLLSLTLKSHRPLFEVLREGVGGRRTK